MTELSQGGTDVVALSHNGNGVRFFSHLRDGNSVSGFEPGSAQHRHGTEPDRWVPALKRVGLLTPEGTSPWTGPDVLLDAGRTMLRMAEEEFGLDLPRDAVDGPLKALHVPRP